MTNVAKMIKYLAMGFAIFLTVSIISMICYVVMLLGNIVDNDNSYEEDTNYENTVETTKAKISEKLDISVKRTNIIIKQGDKFSVGTNNKYIKSRMDKDTLYIYEEDHSMLDRYSGDLYIFIPNDYRFKDIDIDNGAGKVEINGLKTEDLSLELGAGKVRLEDIEVYSEMKVNGGAGAMEIVKATVNDMDLDMGAGKVTFSGYLRGENKINAGVGALVVNLFDDEYTVSIDKGIGSATYNGEEMYDDGIYGTGRNKILLDGGIGSIKITTQKIVSVS